MAKILVTMPDDFLHRIDGLATTEQRTRSELIREALRSYMRRSGVFNTQKAKQDAETLENLIGWRGISERFDKLDKYLSVCGFVKIPLKLIIDTNLSYLSNLPT